jgi:superfamily I DNA and/or RNA helicase
MPRVRIASDHRCTQATEPRTALALARADAALVLIGDQKQLAPTVMSQEAAELGLSRSLFTRLHEAPSGVQSLRRSLLSIQYRMHPLLREFPSRTWYGGKLEDGVVAAQRQPPRSFPAPAAKIDDAVGGRLRDGASRLPLAFVDVPGREQSGRHGASKLNRAEAAYIAATARAVLTDLPAADLGIISPYAAQVSEIRKALRQQGVRDVEVRTVDGFQGREKEVILLSAVRANRRQALGFLSDERRLNVALTRARRGLLVMGCRNTLAADPTWNAFLVHCDGLGAVLSLTDLAAHGVMLESRNHVRNTGRAERQPAASDPQEAMVLVEK